MKDLEPYLPHIKKIEGFTPKAKWDYKQHSWGYGTRAPAAGAAITPEQADAELRREFQQAASQVDKFSPGLPAGKRASLASLTFNSGSGWQSKGLGQAVKAGDWTTAAQRFAQYNKVTNPDGTMAELPGLTNRRRTELSWWGQDNARPSNVVPRLVDPGTAPQETPIMPALQALPSEKGIQNARDTGRGYLAGAMQARPRVTHAGATGALQALAHVADVGVNSWLGRQWMDKATADEAKRTGADTASLQASLGAPAMTSSAAAPAYISAAPDPVMRTEMPQAADASPVVAPALRGVAPAIANGGAGMPPIMPPLSSFRPQIGAGVLPDQRMAAEAPLSANVEDRTGANAPPPIAGQSGAMPSMWNVRETPRMGLGAREPVTDLAEGETPYEFAPDQGRMNAGGPRDAAVPGTFIGGAGQVRDDARGLFDGPPQAQARPQPVPQPAPRQSFNADDVRNKAQAAIEQHTAYVRGEMERLKPMLGSPTYRAQAIEQMQRLRGQLSPNVLNEIRKNTILSERELSKTTDASKVMEVGGKLVRVNPDNTVTELFGSDPVTQRRQQITAAGLDPEAQTNKVYIATGKMPREDQAPLTATDKEAIGEAEDQVIAARNVLSILGEAEKLNPQANTGYFASTRASLGNNLPDWLVPDAISSPEGSKATANYENLVLGQALAQLKSTFGAAPTEGERKILVELQGSIGAPIEVRRDILRRNRMLAEKRLRENTDRASAIRGGTYYKPGQGPGAANAQSQAASSPLDDARSAISRGAPRDAVIQRLRQNGIDPAGL